MNNLIAAALEENPVAFKREFEREMKSRMDNLTADRKIEIAKSITVDGEESSEE